MHWCFALINGRLVEVHFDKVGRGICIFAHAFVKRAGYKTRHERKMIDTDTKKFKLLYRNKQYTDTVSGKVFRACTKPKWLKK